MLKIQIDGDRETLKDLVNYFCFAMAFDPKTSLDIGIDGDVRVLTNQEVKEARLKFFEKAILEHINSVANQAREEAEVALARKVFRESRAFTKSSFTLSLEDV